MSASLRKRLNCCVAENAVHWSGHKSRLDRDLNNRFDTKAYAAEELVPSTEAEPLAFDLK
jgi:antirestriction protein ArdC